MSSLLINHPFLYLSVIKVNTFQIHHTYVGLSKPRALTRGANPSPFAQFGMIPKNPYAGLCPSAPDEPGDPQPGDEPDLPATHDPFAPGSSHGELDPATGAGGTPQGNNDTTFACSTGRQQRKQQSRKRQ
ncbi:hypothetical protein LTR96_007053 [Exophiala xenobiotica]|nr:hypothetical protein LTR96_007053 [Exophiala xenobiotica]KAK5377445.1 hypothetical protein LTS13_004315 [Exophiala xenobiotica]KAK5393454.1 hypothetical protein LTR79_009122 [Exophiala xenobiotica]KAK5420493.1 hypothetical protein LTR90_003386 [Exophiala xenobiotica]KAK5445967.1 hypothetical protein LTR18_003886 [Exophiala xenobiotica]